MFKDLSLRTKTFVLLLSVVMLATVPLVIYYVETARGLARLGTSDAIERNLEQAVRLQATATRKQDAAGALKRYRQTEVLKDRIVRQVIVVSVCYFCVVVLFALAIGYVFTARITRPLRKLTAATQHLARDDLSYELPAEGGGEIGRLIESFKTMSRDLREARKQRLIAERRATWQRVARIIAHEIKNPLTPIKLSTERMYEKFAAGSGDFPAVLKSTTTTILSEIANLRKLVETFHRYAKFPDPVLRRGDLNAVIGEVCAMFEGETARIEVASAERLPPVDIDAGQIREALTNLVRNALDAVGDSPGQGVVCVRSLCRVDQVVVEIADNGCGIAPEHRDNLFQPYFTTKEHGNGIGLALTERIISLHGGTIGFEGEPGEGTTFYVALPAVGAGVAGDTETNNG